MQKRTKIQKMMLLVLALAFLFTGCSIEKNSAAVVDTIDESHATAPLTTSQQTQVPLENPAPNVTDTNISELANPEAIDSSKSPFEKGYYDYQGTIGDNLTIQMSLYPQGEEIVGSYLYEKQQKELFLKGKADEKELVVLEFDEAGKNTGTFQGKLNSVDSIQGTWTSVDNKTSYPFTLSLKSIIPGAEYGKRYASLTGTQSDKNVEDYARDIQNSVMNNNKENLSEQINYPIKVKIDGKEIELQNKEDFINNYNEIFRADFKQSIQNSVTKYMFVNWQGIMFGSGTNNIWINVITPDSGNPKLMITAINN